MRNNFLALGIGVFLGTLLQAQDIKSIKTEGEIINFASFIDLLGKNHPERNLDQLTERRSEAAEKKAGIIVDPEISVTRDKVPYKKPMESGDREPMPGESPEWTLTITQMLPWPGTLSAERRTAQAFTRGTKAATSLQAAQRIFAGKELFIKLVAAQAQQAIEQENLGEATAIAKSAENRLANAIGSHHELLEAKNEATIIELNLQATAADFLNLKDHAAQWLGKNDSSQFTFALSLPQVYRSPPAKQSKVSQTPDLTQEVIDATKQGALARLEAERKRSLPRLSLSGMLMQKDESKEQMVGFMAGINIPLFSGTIRGSLDNEAQIAASRAEQELAWHTAQKQLAIQQNTRRIEALSKQVTVLDAEIIPTYRRHLKLRLLEYAQGKTSFGAVNEARRLLLRYQISAVLAQRELSLALIMQERIEAGLIDMAIDQPTAQLAAPAMANSAGGEMGSGMGTRESMGLGRSPSTKDKMQQPKPMPEEERPMQDRSGGMNGM